MLWLSDAKKPETFERRLQILVEELTIGKPTSMH
ncbi:MAG: YdeI/OmpD-associated family protein [Anaerolineales bacterium]